jgi:DNA repair exonuclease SbcCD ATPase subunit
MSDTKVKSTPKGIAVPVDKLMGVVLERSISDKDQTIGAYKQTIKHLEEKNTELTGQLNAEKSKAPIVADDQKVAVISDANSNSKTCPHCGYTSNTTNKYCYECDNDLKGVIAGPRVIEYRNMDTVIADIRKEEAKTLKVDNVELEKELNSTSFKLDKVTNQYNITLASQMQELTDAKREVRDRYQKEADEQSRKFEKQIEENDKKIDELVEEIQKLEENKTDAEVEEARKQEIIDLKTQVTELETVITEAQAASTPRMKKFWQRIADRKETRKLEEEKETKLNRVDEISNRYPINTTKTNPWWKKGKYAQNTKDAVEELNEARNRTS